MTPNVFNEETTDINAAIGDRSHGNESSGKRTDLSQFIVKLEKRYVYRDKGHGNNQKRGGVPQK